MTIGINITGQLQIVLVQPNYDGDEFDKDTEISIFEKLKTGEYAYSISDNQIIDITNLEVIANVDIIDTENLEYEYENLNND